MIESYLGEREALRLVVLLVDGRHDVQDMDAALFDALRAFEIPVLVVATKVDKLRKHEKKPRIRALREGFGLPEGQLLAFSSRSGEGRDELWRFIETACRR
jgi:GTP-binding protein